MPRRSRTTIPELTPEQAALLRDETFADGEAFPILGDIETLLHRIGDGIELAGAHLLLPQAMLHDLNQAMTRPYAVALQRPQLRSFPNLQGLYLCLRASGLTEIDFAGKRPRLRAHRLTLDAWRALNRTERYFHLLEAWTVHANPKVINAYPMHGGLMAYAVNVWSRVPRAGARLTADERRDKITGVDPDRYTLALLDLFGLLRIEQAEPDPAAPWLPGVVRHTPYGDALLIAIARRSAAEVNRLFDDADDEPELPESNASADDPADLLNPPRFGTFHYGLAEHVPQYQQTLDFPRQPTRNRGVMTFKVTLGKIWRRLAVPVDATLDDVAAAILTSVRFDDDHLYQFTLHDRVGRALRFEGPDFDEWAMDFDIGDIPPMPSHAFTLGVLPMSIGQAMEFLFDFGDEWRFQLVLEGYDEDRTLEAPKVVESHGKAPKQYGW